MMEDSENMPHLADYDEQPDVGPTVDVDSSVNRVTSRRVGILVLGMHRSGTSAITRMLGLLGCALPATLMPAHPTNPAGHWESDAIAQFNDEILTLAGTQWHDWLPVNSRLSETLIWPQLIARGRSILRQEFPEAPLFVLKDPRICKLAGFWLEVLAAEGIEVASVLPVRNPIEVARSLATRDGIEEHQGLLIWLRHVLAAEAATRGQARVFTDYASLLSNWEELSVRLSAGLGLVWPRVSALSGSEISQFLTPDLRHHVTDTAELGQNPAVSAWVRQAYEVLLGWARQGEQSSDYAALDGISRAFDDAGTAFARPMLNGQLAAQRAAQADADRAALAAERDTIARRVAAVEAEFAQVGAERDARTAERDVLAGERAAVAEQRDQLARELGDLAAKYDDLCAERDGQTAERNQLAAERAGLSEERDQLAWRLGEVEADFARVGSECAARTAERDELAIECAAIADKRDKIAWRLGEVEADFTRACDERAALADARDKVAWRLGEVEAELAGAKAENEQVRARASQFEDDLTAARTGADLLGHRLAVTESTLRQREEEIAQLGTEVATTRAEAAQRAAAGAEASAIAERLTREGAVAVDTRQRLEILISQAEDRASRAEAENEAKGHQLTERIAELSARLHQSAGDAAALKMELDQATVRQDNHLAEIDRLTRLHRVNERKFGEQLKRAEWLHQLSALMLTAPRWWTFIPPIWRRKRELRRLERSELFDGPAYLALNPDVAAEGMDPLRHYILHGLVEGRQRQ